MLIRLASHGQGRMKHCRRWLAAALALLLLAASLPDAARSIRVIDARGAAGPTLALDDQRRGDIALPESQLRAAKSSASALSDGAQAPVAALPGLLPLEAAPARAAMDRAAPPPAVPASRHASQPRAPPLPA